MSEPTGAPEPKNAYERGIKGIQRPDDGVWATLYLDGSAAAIYETEIDALRAGIIDSMAVRFWPFGTDLNDLRR